WTTAEVDLLDRQRRRHRWRGGQRQGGKIDGRGLREPREIGFRYIRYRELHGGRGNSVQPASIEKPLQRHRYGGKGRRRRDVGGVAAGRAFEVRQPVLERCTRVGELRKVRTQRGLQGRHLRVNLRRGIGGGRRHLGRKARLRVLPRTQQAL